MGAVEKRRTNYEFIICRTVTQYLKTSLNDEHNCGIVLERLMCGSITSVSNHELT